VFVHTSFYWQISCLRALRTLLSEVGVLLIIIIVLLVLWAPGYYGYGRSRWGIGYGGDIVTLLLIIILLWAIFGGRL
jgi:hypothetical protein